MHEAEFCKAFRLHSRAFLVGFRRPIGTDVGKDRGFVGEKVFHNHAEAIAVIPFGSEDRWVFLAVPIEGS